MRTHWTWPSVALIALAGTMWMVRDDSRAQPRPRAGGTVAVVDVAELFNECHQTKDLDEMLQQIRTDMAERARRKNEAITQAKGILDAYNPNSADARKQRHKVETLQVELEAFGTMVQNDMERERMSLTIETYEKIEQAIAEVVEARGFEVVLSYHPAELKGTDTNAIRREIILREVLYRVEAIDLTKEVLARLNKSYDDAGGRSTLRLLIGPQE